MDADPAAHRDYQRIYERFRTLGKTSLTRTV